MPSPTPAELKSFSLIFATVFAVVFVGVKFNYDYYPVWSLVSAVLFLMAAFFLPSSVKWLYHIWQRFGRLISGVVSPLVMGILFFCVFTPMALVLKVMGKDLLNKKIDKTQSSYWLPREKQPGSLKNQF